MSTKVEPSGASTGTKISFAVKKGFLIPKNKLSGSLVPTFRDPKKEGTSDVVKEESNKQPPRKTKWGPDLTQDAAVKKPRASAYQMRVDQITEQLKSGFLEPEDNQESLSAAENPSFQSSVQKKTEILELERREAIGELLKLNPSYKPPSDYKPLLKEAKVPVPIKEHLGYNFIGVIFGSSSDTVKRLEKETGAKVRVFGIKANTREKAEITSADANESRGAYEELYVHVSADTYEKVDAAVAFIELLVKPVLVNQATVSTAETLASGDVVNVGDQYQGTSVATAIPPVGVNPEFLQPMIGSAQTQIQHQFQPYPGPWFSQDPPQPPVNSRNAPTFFSQMPVPQPPFMHQGYFGPSAPPPQPSAMKLPPVSRPPGPPLGSPLSFPHGPHPVSQQPISSGPAAYTNVPPHMSSFIPNQGVPIQQPMVRPATSNQTPFSQPMSATAPPPPPPLQSRNPSFTPVQPPLLNQNMHRPNSVNFTFQPQMPPNLPSQADLRPMHNMPVPHQNQPFRPEVHNQNQPFRPEVHNQNQPFRPEVHNQNQPFRPEVQNQTQPFRPEVHNQNQPFRPEVHNQNQPFRPEVLNPSAQEILEALLRPLLNQSLNQFAPFHDNLNLGPQRGPRNNQFPGPLNSHGFHMDPRSSGNHFLRRPGNSLQSQGNFSRDNRQQNFYPPHTQRGGNVSRSFGPNSGQGAQQVYDPFSPSAVSNPPGQRGSFGETRKQEDDPEYQDLMDSVGMR